jgi:Cys-tRNA(Pro) deacylase
MDDTDPDTPATRAVAGAGVSHRVVQFGHVGSLEEAARAQGLRPEQVLKSLVVRRGEDDYLLVLVPGGSKIAWPKLRAELGVNRVSLPDADEAFEVTGYVRGTITPFGAKRDLPIVIDAAVMAQQVVTVGGGQQGVSIHLAPADLIAATDATIADVTEDL